MTNNGYKLLVVDIDGTLLGCGGISVADKKALFRARDRGVQVSLSTGRAWKACEAVIRELGLDSYHVWFDGALVSTADLTHELWARPLPPDLVEEMVEFAHARGIDLELYTSTEYLAERDTWSTHAHEDFFGVECVFSDFDGVWRRERIIKGGVVVSEPEEPATARRLLDHFGGRIGISEARTPNYPGIVFNNILAPDVSKGAAVRQLASHLGIGMDAVMAVGDGSNDLPLLRVAGLAVAMGNASEQVKAAAHYVTLDVDHSGLAAAIERFLL